MDYQIIHIYNTHKIKNINLDIYAKVTYNTKHT